MKFVASIAPLQAAVDLLDNKAVVASKVRTKDWQNEDLDERMKLRAFWSAGVENVKFLDTARLKMKSAVALQREKVKRGEAFVDRSSFIGDMRKVAFAQGLGDGTGGLTDPTSRVRLGLIFDMQLRQMQGFAQRKIDLDPDVLDAFPAQELYRAEERRQQRDWFARWQEAGNKVGWKGALQDRMIALKTSPIWVEVSVFRRPWAPFDWGSGMDLRDVDRAEAEQIGLLAPGADVPPVEGGDLTDSLEASVAGLSDLAIRTLKNLFGDRVSITGDRARWRDAA